MSADSVDLRALEKVAEWGGDSLVQQLLELFFETTPVRIAATIEAAGGGDLKEGARAAHSLRSSAGNVGARILSGLAAEAEKALNAGDLDTARGLAERLQAEFREVSAVLRRHTADAAQEEQSTHMLPRIAVVEDNPDNRLLVQALIGDRYDILEYEAGPDALEGIRADPPDLVLLDISLPGMDGTEVLAELRGDPRFQQLPVIALTAHAMAGDRDKYLALGFDDYVTKPIVDEDVLIGAIERWLSRAR